MARKGLQTDWLSILSAVDNSLWSTKNRLRLRRSWPHSVPQIHHWVLHPSIRPHAERPLSPLEKWLIIQQNETTYFQIVYYSWLWRDHHLLSSAEKLGGGNRQISFRYGVGRHILPSSAHNMSSTETAYEIMSYWYLTLVRISTWNDECSKECWRGCSGKCSLQLSWHCPKLIRFWDQVLNDLDKAFATSFHVFLSILYLGFLIPRLFPSSRRGKHMALALGAAHQVILVLCGTGNKTILTCSFR